MKEKHNIKTLLGLTQEEMALLLGVSRSQWSMYELGKRDLPLHATQQLTELLLQVESRKNKISTPISDTDKKQQVLLWQEELELLKHNQKILEHKIDALHKIHNEIEVALSVVEYMKTTPLSNQQQTLMEKIKNRCVALQKRHPAKRIVILQNKIDVILVHRITLTEKIKSNNNDTLNVFV